MKRTRRMRIIEEQFVIQIMLRIMARYAVFGTATAAGMNLKPPVNILRGRRGQRAGS